MVKKAAKKEPVVVKEKVQDKRQAGLKVVLVELEKSIEEIQCKMKKEKHEDVLNELSASYDTLLEQKDRIESLIK